jgi:hypothetical protein
MVAKNYAIATTRRTLGAVFCGWNPNNPLIRGVILTKTF